MQRLYGSTASESDHASKSTCRRDAIASARRSACDLGVEARSQACAVWQWTAHAHIGNAQAQVALDAAAQATKTKSHARREGQVHEAKSAAEGLTDRAAVRPRLEIVSHVSTPRRGLRERRDGTRALRVVHDFCALQHRKPRPKSATSRRRTTVQIFCFLRMLFKGSRVLALLVL